ncbi:MAG: immunoglobulin domain-containing protein, partial [Opitutaceae bacterium]
VQPVSQTVALGASVTLAVNASGLPSPSFQWLKNGADISGATGSVLTLDKITPADAAIYTAVASNSAGSASSRGAVLTVIANAPAFTAQPMGQTATPGVSVTFKVAASGMPAPAIQWQKNGADISGATDLALTLSRVTPDDAAAYTAVATNCAGTVTSHVAVLTVDAVADDASPASAPVILAQPVARKVAAGASVTFTVAASGTAPLSYQWQFNGNAIGGATTPSFTIGSVQNAEAGLYSVSVSNSAGSVASSFVSLLLDSGQASPYLEYPTGVACDGEGHVYVVDAAENVVEKISGSEIAILAGTAGVAGAQDGAGASAQFNQPTGIAVDPAGNIFIADSGNGTVRKITPAGIVTTLAGSSSGRGNTDGTGSAASFVEPTSVASDGLGGLFVADPLADTIRKISTNGAVTTLAGANGVRGDTDAAGSAAFFNHPSNVAVDADGVVYVADTYNDLIRKIAPSGAVTTLAGLSGVSGYTDGTGSNALFNQPAGIAIDVAGNIFVADTGNSAIRKITKAGVVVTIAGLPTVSGRLDGPAADAAEFNRPRGLCVDLNENIYVADTGNGVVRKIDPSGRTTTLTSGVAPMAPFSLNPFQPVPTSASGASSAQPAGSTAP